jgi:hypothetical protein
MKEPEGARCTGGAATAQALLVAYGYGVPRKQEGATGEREE